jgi:hypothetical protein
MQESRKFRRDLLKAWQVLRGIKGGMRFMGKVRRCFARVHAWVGKHGECLAAYSSLATILAFPIAVLGLYFAYTQIVDLLARPQVSLDLHYAESLTYMVHNESPRLAEEVTVGFAICDLDDSNNWPLSIPTKSYPFVNSGSAIGPFSFMVDFAKSGHHYYGMISVNCKLCERIETYRLFSVYGRSDSSFYCPETKNEMYWNADFRALSTNRSAYLDSVIPKSRRVYVGQPSKEHR